MRIIDKVPNSALIDLAMVAQALWAQQSAAENASRVAQSAFGAVKSLSRAT
jgi:hypothetical protein